MGGLPLFLGFAGVLGATLFAHVAQAEESQRRVAPSRAPAEVSAVSTERSGVSFGASYGLGTISHQGVVFAGELHVGYALSPRVVLLGDFVAFLWSGADPPSRTASLVEWRDLAFYSLTSQILLIPRLWVRPGFGTAQWHAIRYTATASGQQVADLGGYVPALLLAAGVDVAAGKHNVFDMAISTFGFTRDHELTYAGALLLGYSYY